VDAIWSAAVAPGEDAAAYDELLARICEVVRPVDVIEEMFINDVLALEWEVLRWRGSKAGLLQACGLKALEDFLAEKLEDYYSRIRRCHPRHRAAHCRE
jgi:hypothetical protein